MADLNYRSKVNVLVRLLNQTDPERENHTRKRQRGRAGGDSGEEGCRGGPWQCSPTFLRTTMKRRFSLARYIVYFVDNISVQRIIAR